jgi:hypothetical protein
MGFDINRLAYCGIYCDQCSFLSAYETNDRKHLQQLPSEYFERHSEKELSEFFCPGCKGDNICGDCKMKECGMEKKFGSCAECDVFPCDELNGFAQDGVPHHAWAFENLKKIKESGAENWYRDFKSNLTCGGCGERLSWYYTCPRHSDFA